MKATDRRGRDLFDLVDRKRTLSTPRLISDARSARSM